MIVSHRHRYVFVELPRTGSTAIREELRDLYDGEPILFKHATYEDFLRVATPAERDYFVFSGIRHPLDDVVSRYFKLLTDHRGQFSQGAAAARKPLLVRLVDERQFRFVERTGADFAAFFLRYYRFPYDTWASLSHRRMDFVIRFEHLAEDFEAALRRIGVDPKRPLPVVNRTTERDADFRAYYPPETWPRARRVFGPYMERWGYEFPDEWTIEPPSRLHRAAFTGVDLLGRLYWRHVRPRLHGSTRERRNRRRRSSYSG